jgi:hypothetical protein
MYCTGVRWAEFKTLEESLCVHESRKELGVIRSLSMSPLTSTYMLKKFAEIAPEICRLHKTRSVELNFGTLRCFDSKLPTS